MLLQVSGHSGNVADKTQAYVVLCELIEFVGYHFAE
jgi:hypothetical protein